MTQWIILSNREQIFERVGNDVLFTALELKLIAYQYLISIDLCKVTQMLL